MKSNLLPLPVKAVMVDLDGTMLDTAADLAAAANMMLERLGFPGATRRPSRPISVKACSTWSSAA